MITGIYQILNTTDGKIYIGKAKDILCRWRNHRYQLKKGIHKNAHLQAAYNLDGVEAFLYSVVEECDVSVLEEREAFHIARLNAVNSGYNLLAPLPSNHGVRYHSEESRRKMSEAQQARGPLTEEHREKIRLNNAFTGKRRPPETIERMRQAQQNRNPLSEDGKLRMSIAARTRGMATELREEVFDLMKSGVEFKAALSMLKSLKAA